MQVALYKDESARLADLEGYSILDSPAENAFDRLTRITAGVMQTPISLVTFVARDRQFVKSCFGISLRETPRDVSFCAHTILSESPFIVLDTLADARFAQNPLVTGPPYIRYYVGTPLISSLGFPLGALCVIDSVPHESPSETQLALLGDLAAEVVEQLEFRSSRHDLEKSVYDLSEVQKALLRATPASCFLHVDFCCYPKHMAGGDFLCHYRVNLDQELLLLTDVSGHDLKAAYLAAHSQGMVRAMINRGVPIDDIFEELNTYFVEQNETPGSVGTSLAACGISYCTHSSELVVRNYGSPLPVYIDLSGFPHLLDDAKGSTLGWFPSLEDSITYRVLSGGFVVAWTDGLEDLAFELGVTPLNMALRLYREGGEAPRPEWLSRARDDVMSTFIKLPPFTVDSAEQEWFPFVFQRWEPESVKEIDAIQHAWGRDLQFAIPGICDWAIFDVLLCSREAALNGLVHGCKDGGEVTIFMRLNTAQKLIRVTVCDEGPGHSFDPRTRESLDLPSGHRGLLLIQQLSKACIRERNGASLTMEFAYELNG